jgi:hypothetical protein
MYVASAFVTPTSVAMATSIAAGNVHRRVRASRPQPAPIAGDTTHEAHHVA